MTALATDVFLGNAKRFVDGKALASYVDSFREYSSGERQRLGKVTKQGSPLLRFLWGEAGAHGVRRDPELQRFYRRKLVHKGLGKARVAVPVLPQRIDILVHENAAATSVYRRT